MKISIDSESAITLVLGNDISLDTHLQVVALADAIKKSAFPGLLEVVPAYAALTIHFDPFCIRQRLPIGAETPTAFVVRNLLEIKRQNSRLSDIEDPAHFEKKWALETPLLEIPVRYGGVEGPDLPELADRLQLAEPDIVRLHAASTYCVFMIGFLPGFPYLGPLPDALVVPRRATPRMKVAAGSVAIAGRQTGIYPQTSPGGWHVIGHTDVCLFDPHSPSPSLLKPGMRVQFVPSGR